MADEKQLARLTKGVKVWNKWRDKARSVHIDLSEADLSAADLSGARLWGANLNGANLTEANLNKAVFTEASLSGANLNGANLKEALLGGACLRGANLKQANLKNAFLLETNFTRAILTGTNLSKAVMDSTIFGDSDLSEAIGLEDVLHGGPSSISTDTFAHSKGRISEGFLKGCGLSDWEIESVKLYKPNLSDKEFVDIQNRIFDLRQRKALQISNLFISYSHADSEFVDKLESQLNNKGIRFWRDVHDMKSGRMETQIDHAIRLNPTVLLILSKHSLKSNWVEHEVREARKLEEEMERDALCPVALDDSWKNSSWPKRIMEQVMEYNILDFSEWKVDAKFESTFNKLIDGLGLFYK